MDDGCLDYLACPLCRAGLSANQSALECGICQQQFRYVRGIPILSTQMVSNRQPARTEFSGSFFTDLLQHAPADLEGAWRDFYINFIKAVSSQDQSSRMVLNLVDETKAAIKYLLNISPNDHVLNLGPGWDNTSISLARSAAKVTVLDLDLSGLAVLMFKKIKYNLDNIELVFGGDLNNWPLKDNTFNTVIVQNSLIWSIITSAYAGDTTDKELLNADQLVQKHPQRSNDIRKNCLSILLSEIKRVLKPDGSVFLGVQPYAKAGDVDSDITKLTAWLEKGAVPTDQQADLLNYNLAVFKNRSQVGTEIEKSGLRLNGVYQISTHRDVPNKMIKLSTGSFKRERSSWVNKIFKSWRKKQQRKNKSVGGFTAFGSPQGEAWINGMLQDCFQSCDISPKAYALSHMHISRKGKAVILLSDAHTNQYRLVVKVPIHEKARSMLEKNHQTLEYLTGLKTPTKSSKLIRGMIPQSLHAGTYKGQPYFAEQGFEGAAWKSIGRPFSDKVLWPQIFTVLGNLNRIVTSPKTPDSQYQKYTHRLESIDALLDNIGKSEGRGWEIVKDTINEALLNHSEQLYFRKGDCSMHNILVRSGKVAAFIDFDEAGWTPYKTVDLADLLFSFARTRKKIDRAAFIKMIVQENYGHMGLSIPMGECLDYLKADPPDLKISILISWIDHVYHAIQFEAIRYRKYIKNLNRIARYDSIGVFRVRLGRNQGQMLVATGNVNIKTVLGI